MSDAAAPVPEAVPTAEAVEAAVALAPAAGPAPSSGSNNGNKNNDNDNENDETIRQHIEQVVAAHLPHSAIYHFLLSAVRIRSAIRGRVRARLTLTSHHVNSRGGIHGAVSAAIVDWAGGLAIASWDLREKTGVSVDIHVRYLSSARVGDEVEIEGRADKVGGSVAFTTVVISKVVSSRRGLSGNARGEGEGGDGEGEGEGGEEEVVGPVIATGTHTKYVRQQGR
ncbi:hypothetical protein SLS62_003568 [Diatrype stigma]|uniref:Thioesterase domain-containing protein n=1 Tax=Diatrype stigma TaxID=117547 RepID=A0AAN9YTZ3_9PEZI